MKVFSDWTKYEKLWLGIFSFIIVITTVFFSWNGTDYSDWFSVFLNWLLSPLSAVTGMLCVIYAAKGNIYTYVFGLINCVTYGLIAYIGGYYGDMLLNWIILLPMQFGGYFWWKKHLRPKSRVYVRMRRLTWQQRLVIAVIGVGLTVLVGILLNNVDSWITAAFKRSSSIYHYIDSVFGLPFLGSMFDASTEILQIVAQVLMVYAYAEQWTLWTLTNIITIIMWSAVILADPSAAAWVLPTLIMWLAYLVNSVYGYTVWKKGSKENGLSLKMHTQS